MAVRHHIRVLVVDDDPTVCKAIQAILESHDYYAETYTSPNEALKAAEERAFHIALIDVKMPELDGVQFVDKLREVDDRVCPVAMTAYPDVKTAAQIMRRGGRDYILKPFRQEQLISTLERICRELGLIYTSEKELNRLIGQRIRQERLRQSLTLRQLSSRTDLTTSQLSQVELGKNAASLWALARICGALGIRISELLKDL